MALSKIKYNQVILEVIVNADTFFQLKFEIFISSCGRVKRKTDGANIPAQQWTSSNHNLTIKMTDSSIAGMVDPKIFEDLQKKIDDDAETRDQIRAILTTLERQGRQAQSVLSRAHSTPAAHRKKPFWFGYMIMNDWHWHVQVQPVIAAAETAIKEELDSIVKLAAIASDIPYYK